jgi:transcriptional regulator with XRE-family HTH domain
MTRRIIPEKLRELRKAKGLSTTELASAINASEVTVRTWEAGRYSPAPWNLPRLAEALGVPVEDFTTDRCPACGQTLPEES